MACNKTASYCLRGIVISAMVGLLAACGADLPGSHLLDDANQYAAHLAAVTIRNFHVVDAHVYRGGRPTLVEVAQLKDLGVRTILSLETYAVEPWEGFNEQQETAKLGMNFERIAMSPLPYPEPSVTQINDALKVLMDPDMQPVFVHCYHGSDRTGVTVGAYRIVADGWTVDSAISEIEIIGHSSSLYNYWDNLLYDIH